MKKGIIIAHPWKESFNHAILQALKEGFTEGQVNFEVIDLHADDFNPVYTAKELSKYKDGVALDPIVFKYQETLKNIDELIIIFPIWWYSVPAILKGFFDKVMLKGFSYEESPSGLKGKLSHIRKTTIITTSEGPTWYIKLFKGNYINGVFKKGILRDIGIKNTKWINFSNIKSSTKEKREKFLKELNV